MGNTPKERLLGMLGLCIRARRAVCGTVNVCEALKAGKAALVVTACDNSPATDKRISDRTDYYGVRMIKTGLTAAQIGAATGKGLVAAMAITDASMAEAVRQKAEKDSAE
ncbi:MAG: L7Ae/L30e/S12e/Gadd45 family ribosomal protein [Eubacteriales bacterium]